MLQSPSALPGDAPASPRPHPASPEMLSTLGISPCRHGNWGISHQPTPPRCKSALGGGGGSDGSSPPITLPGREHPPSPQSRESRGCRAEDEDGGTVATAIAVQTPQVPGSAHVSKHDASMHPHLTPASHRPPPRSIPGTPSAITSVPPRLPQPFSGSSSAVPLSPEVAKAASMPSPMSRMSSSAMVNCARVLTICSMRVPGVGPSHAAQGIAPKSPLYLSISNPRCPPEPERCAGMRRGGE